MNQSNVKLWHNDAVNNLYYPLAVMVSIALAPGINRPGKENTLAPEKEKAVDHLHYEFCMADMNEETIDLRWQTVVPALDGATHSAAKYSVCLFGPLSFSYGSPLVDMDIDEITLNYCINDQSISIDLDMVRAEIQCIIESRYGKPVYNFSFGTVSAKVRRLDLQKAEKKRQDNVFCKPHDFDQLIEWQAGESASAF